MTEQAYHARGAGRELLVKEFESFAPWIIQHSDTCSYEATNGPHGDFCDCGKRERVQRWREALRKLREPGADTGTTPPPDVWTCEACGYKSDDIGEYREVCGKCFRGADTGTMPPPLPEGIEDVLIHMEGVAARTGQVKVSEAHAQNIGDFARRLRVAFERAISDEIRRRHDMFADEPERGTTPQGGGRSPNDTSPMYSDDVIAAIRQQKQSPSAERGTTPPEGLSDTMDREIAFAQRLCANKQPHDWEMCNHCHYLADSLVEWGAATQRAPVEQGRVAFGPLFANAAREIGALKFDETFLNECARIVCRAANEHSTAPDHAREGALTFAGFSRVNRERCESKDGFNHALNSWSTSDWFLALLGELGEAANVAKKLNRYRDGIPGNKQSKEELEAMLRAELGDSYVYLDLLAQSLNVAIGEAASEVFNAKSEQLGCPIRMERALADGKEGGE